MISQYYSKLPCEDSCEDTYIDLMLWLFSFLLDKYIWVEDVLWEKCWIGSTLCPYEVKEIINLLSKVILNKVSMFEK